MELHVTVDKNIRTEAWKIYIQELFDDTRPEPNQRARETGYDEIHATITKLKLGKAPGSYHGYTGQF